MSSSSNAEQEVIPVHGHQHMMQLAFWIQIVARSAQSSLHTWHYKLIMLAAEEEEDDGQE